ncbi:hypothetical protein [Desulfosporosinus fructosivorans]
MVINYDEIFPVKAKVPEGPMIKYVVRLSLVAPKNNYDLTGICEDIDIPQTFSKAADRYNEHPSRRLDGGKIINIKVRSDDIVFTLQIKSGHMKSMRNTIGNSISKWLYTDYCWKRLTALSDTELRKKLFTVEYVEVS